MEYTKTDAGTGCMKWIEGVKWIEGMKWKMLWIKELKM